MKKLSNVNSILFHIQDPDSGWIAVDQNIMKGCKMNPRPNSPKALLHIGDGFLQTVSISSV